MIYIDISGTFLSSWHVWDCWVVTKLSMNICVIFRSIDVWYRPSQDFSAGSRAAIGGGVLDNYQYRIQVDRRVGKRSGQWVYWPVRICLMKISPGFAIFLYEHISNHEGFGVSLTSEGFWGVEFSCLLMCTALTMLWGIGNWIGWSSTVVTLPSNHFHIFTVEVFSLCSAWRCLHGTARAVSCAFAFALLMHWSWQMLPRSLRCTVPWCVPVKILMCLVLDTVR